MFAIGKKEEWPGFSKLCEECGELVQVIGKFMGSRGLVKHWSGNLLDKLYEEMGDVQAALWFVADACKLDKARLQKQAAYKLKRFHFWHENETTVDSLDDEYECACADLSIYGAVTCAECLKRGH